MWQRSPISGAKQRNLNMNFANARVFQGVLPALQQRHEVIMNRAAIPLPVWRDELKKNLAISQYRHDTGIGLVDDPVTFLAYPVFDTFDEDRELAGVLATNVYWKLFFTNILPIRATGYICVLENSYNQTLAYRIDGPAVTYLGEGDQHDPHYEYLEESADINSFATDQAGPETRSYTTVPLSKEFGKYRLRIYPSAETEDPFTTNDPLVYTSVVASAFLITSLIFLAFAFVVEKRQRTVMERIVKTATMAAATERELNEFLAHEVRNPLSVAMTAYQFVDAAVKQIPPYAANAGETKDSLRDDVKIIGSSLYFIDDFLRSMLDIFRASANKIKVELAPTDLLKDVLEPVCTMLYQRNIGIVVNVECPDQLVVMTDCLRLKQVMMNLGRNSTKFTQKGFIRFRAAVVDGLVELYVEDSGPGIPDEKRGALFEKFQTSALSEGTGVGLNLCMNLSQLMNGDISLDEDYDSGVPGSPGSRFVVKLNSRPLSTETILKSSQMEGNQGSCELTCQPDENRSVLSETLSVLFVDDDTILRKLFLRSLQKVVPAWSAQEAACGEAALQLVDSEHFDVMYVV
jgi:signal transduction histidine kinase